jgi:hypothetical protein
MQSLRAVGQNFNLGDLGSIAIAMLGDPHTLLSMASMIPGIGGVFAAADVALYLYEGDYQNAALAALQFLPGGALLAVGGALKGAKAIGKSVGLMASAGARGLGALAHGAGKLVGGIASAAGSRIKAILSTVGSKIKAAGARIEKWAGKGGDAGGDIQQAAVSYEREGTKFRVGVKDKTWKNAIEPSTGRVRDPVTGRFMSQSKPWQMGHKPGFEFRKLKVYSQEEGLSRGEFLDLLQDPQHYRPELPRSNMGHAGEAPENVNLHFGQ